jgi:hypothetical protein
MNLKSGLFLFAAFAIIISCASDQKKDSIQYAIKKDPGPEYQYLGMIYVGKYVVSTDGTQKILASSAFTASSEKHLISKMLDQTIEAGGDFCVIDSITSENLTGDGLRFYGVGRVFKLKESYGKAGLTILSEKGHMVQYVMRMEPGHDYEAMKSVDSPLVKTGIKGEITVSGKTSDEAIIVLRNSAAEIGGSLVVVDRIDKVTADKIESYTARGRIFRLKSK